MSGDETSLVAAAALAAGDDVLVLGLAADVVFAAHELAGEEGWIYAVDHRVEALEQLLAEAHVRGSTGIAYLVGDPALLPLPDGSVDAALVAAADPDAVAPELLRVLRPGGRLALAGGAAPGGLVAAGFADVVAAGGSVRARKPG